MGIGTSSSSSGASAPRANAYAVNRDASELRRSPRAEGTGLSSAWPDARHLYVRGHRDTAPQRDKVTRHGTKENGPHSREIPAHGPFPQVVAGARFELA